MQNWHPSENAELPSFSEDLVAHAFKHLMLLHAVDTWPNGGLYAGKNVASAVNRYLNVYMPLYTTASPDQRQGFEPPLDVAWVWHVHRLNPVQYHADCVENYGKRVDPDPSLAFSFTTRAPVRWTRLALTSHRREGPVRFYPPAEGPTPALAALQPFRTTYDLQAAVARQSTFLFQMLRACYTDPWYIQYALQRYRHFLLLKKKRPELFVVPMYDIDFIWHTHQSLSGVYAADCQAFLGYLLNHKDDVGRLQRARQHDDDGPAADGAHGSLQESFQETKAAWMELFPGAPYEVLGSCHISPDNPHPATLAMGKALELYDPPEKGASPTWRAGAHALYLQWLVAKGHEEATAKMLVRKKDAGCYAWKYMRRAAREFSNFKWLPHFSSHPYWTTLLKRSLLSQDRPNTPNMPPAGTVGGVALTADGCPVDPSQVTQRRQQLMHGQPECNAAQAYYGFGCTPPALYHDIMISPGVGPRVGPAGLGGSGTAAWMAASGFLWRETFDAVVDLAAGACLLQEGEADPLQRCTVAGSGCGASACGAAVAAAAGSGAPSSELKESDRSKLVAAEALGNLRYGDYTEPVYGPGDWIAFHGLSSTRMAARAGWGF